MAMKASASASDISHMAYAFLCEVLVDASFVARWNDRGFYPDLFGPSFGASGGLANPTVAF